MCFETEDEIKKVFVKGGRGDGKETFSKRPK